MFGAFALVGGKLRPMREALDRSYGEEYESFLHRLRAERERERASAAAGSLRNRLDTVADYLRGQKSGTAVKALRMIDEPQERKSVGEGKKEADRAPSGG